MIVNTGVLWLLKAYAGIPYPVASLIAIQIAIFNNFFWNRRLTWRDRRQSAWRGILGTLRRFILVSWIAGGINWVLLIFLTELLHLHYLQSNILAILVASLVNYFANDRWTFRPVPVPASESHQGTSR